VTRAAFYLRVSSVDQHITDGTTNVDRLAGYGETGHARLSRGRRQERGEHLNRVVLPAPLEPSKPKTSPALTERVRASTAVNAPKRRVRALISRTMSLIENR
jgi:hypothetical protein